MRQRAIFPQPAVDVLHIDDRIVDDFAQRDRQPAQRHGIDRQAEIAEDQRRDQQRDRNGGQRNEGSAEIGQEQEEDDGDHDRAVAQRFLDVIDRGFDEIGLLEQELRRIDALRQALAHLGQSLLDGTGQFHRIRRRLLLH